MNTYRYPEKSAWKTMTRRPVIQREELSDLVQDIFEQVQRDGDQALIEFSRKFDRASLETVAVSEAEIKAAEKTVSKELKAAIIQAKDNITRFHAAQQNRIEKIETTAGVVCWRESRAIEKVGIYIPGGTAPLFSTVLMLAIPAQLAGCSKIILCTPPDQDGNINPAILYAAQLCGVSQVFKAGGAQAVAAMTFGTESIPSVNKIFGPGNQYVVAAKEYAQRFGVAMDMPAGPSEVLVIANESAIPEFCAADLLSQAEHGSDSQVVFITTDEQIFNRTIEETEKQLKALPRNELAAQALANSHFIILNSIEEALEFSNLYAPEHLILAINNFEYYISKIENAGSVFLGNYSCESAGDYASGTNHTLPTNGFASNYSGVSLDSFVKKITFQHLTEEGLNNLGPTIELMAEAEGLMAHKNAVTIRLKS
ncbi:histidinol dehydrogenase [Chryseobacterium camelliae]|uniref:histidinol dehydrogenase n=1 Tax=Chryseobacterium camelliae TaxID=1265445 RepID=UPI0028653A3F|nr:histidinol dehydrogenase [Chryseobacterium camelliae]MDR6515547.1 histidinol dehydrogenase [Chryseobacterium camelliae]